MERSLIFKEWKKMKWFYIGMLLIGLLLLSYVFMSIGRSFRIVGAGHIWDVIVNKNQMMFRNLKYYSVITGACLGVAQFVPEMLQKRIKLTLHLPMAEQRIVLVMLGFGQLLTLSIFLLHVIAVVVFSNFYFPMEILLSALKTLIPWYAAGLLVQSFVAMICIEPTWSRRIANLIMMLGTVQLCYLSSYPGAYGNVLYWLLLLVAFIFPYSFLSLYRFKVGVQD